MGTSWPGNRLARQYVLTIPTARHPPIPQSANPEFRHINEAETQIRQRTLFRKLSGGGRSWTGAWLPERLLSVYRACRKRGRRSCEWWTVSSPGTAPRRSDLPQALQKAEWLTSVGPYR